jgi:protein deglycase
MGENMDKKAMIILADGFEEIEAITAIDILRRGNIKVDIYGLDSTNIKGSKGVVVIADKTLRGDESGYDACVLPGGMPGAENLARSEKVKKVIVSMHEQGKIIAAICAAPAVVLAPLGILDNRYATSYPGMEGAFSDTTDHKDGDIVVDNNIITSRGPATALKFAIAILEALSGQAIALRVSQATLLR